MRKKLTLMFVTLFAIAAFAATHVLNQATRRAATEVNVPDGTELGAFVSKQDATNGLVLNLAENGSYTLTTKAIKVPADLIINGNGATIDASAGNVNFIELQGSTEYALKADGTTVSDHFVVGSVTIKDVTITGLKKAIVRDTQKTYLKTLTIDNSVIEASNGKPAIDFDGKGYVEQLNVTKSTIWAKEATNKNFTKYGSRPKNLWTKDAEDKDVPGSYTVQGYDVQNSTFVNIAATNQHFCNNSQKGTKENVYVIKNNVFVNCGKTNNQVVVGFNGGQTSPNPIWDVDGNVFNYDGADTSAAEVAKAGKKDDVDIVKNSVVGVVAFKNLAEGDFSLAMNSVQYTSKVGDPRWINTAGEDITIAPESGDIAEAITAAQVYAPAKDITINLTEGGAYTLSASIEGAGNIVINGNGATIDASALTDAFVKLDGSTTFEKKSDDTESTYYRYEDVVIKNVTIKNLKQSLAQSLQKSMIKSFVVDNCVINMEANKVVFDFNTNPAYAETWTVKNSTLWSNSGNNKYFIQTSAKCPDIDSDHKCVITLENNTFYQIAKGAQFNNGNQFKGKSYVELNLNNNIFVYSGNAGGNSIRGLCFGQAQENMIKTYEKNTFFADADESANWGKMGAVALTTDPAFADAENGDFTLSNTSDQYKNATGDPRWIIYTPAMTVGSNGSAALQTPTEGAAGTTMTIATTSSAKKYIPIVTVTDADGNQVAVTASKPYEAATMKAEFTFVMPVGGATVDVQFVEQPLASSEAINVEVPANLGAMDGTDGPTDLALFLDSYFANSANPAYIKLTLQAGAKYIISKPLTIMSAIQILGSDASNPAIIDASALGAKPFVQIQSEDEATPALPNAKGFYNTIYNVELKNFIVEKAKGSLFSSNGQKYDIPNLTIDNVVYEARVNVTLISLLGGGIVENLTMTRSTAYTFGNLYDGSGSAKLAEAGVNSQKFTFSYNTLMFTKGLFHADASESAKRTITVDHNVILENTAGFVAGLNAGDANWIVQYNAFQKEVGTNANGDYVFDDISNTEDANGAAGSIKGNMVWVNTKKLFEDLGDYVTNFPMGDCPQRDAMIGDPRWLSAKMRIKEADVDDENDLAKVINEGVKKGYTEFELVQNQNGNLRYTVKQSIVTDKAISITGENVQIDVEHSDPFILLSKTPAVGFMPKASAAAPALNRAAVEYTDYYAIDALSLSGLKINGLKNSIIYDNNTKYCVVDLTIDDCVLGLETEAVKNEALISFQAGGVKDFTIKNSTVYGNNAVAKYFIRYNNSARLDRYGFDKNTEFQTMTYQNNTFYGLLKSDGQWANYSGIAGQNYSKFVVEKNIWYNCGKDIIRRLSGGRFGGNAPRTFDKNTYFNEGADISDAEGSYDNSDTALTTDPGFKKPAEGDFTLSAYSAQCNEQTGDPRWFAEGGHYNPVTGIETVKTAEETSLENAVIYNLNGQRVEKAQKGINQW